MLTKRELRVWLEWDERRTVDLYRLAAMVLADAGLESDWRVPSIQKRGREMPDDQAGLIMRGLDWGMEHGPRVRQLLRERARERLGTEVGVDAQRGSVVGAGGGAGR